MQPSPERGGESPGGLLCAPPAHACPAHYRATEREKPGLRPRELILAGIYGKVISSFPSTPEGAERRSENQE